jgi:plastocyanin
LNENTNENTNASTNGNVNVNANANTNSQANANANTNTTAATASFSVSITEYSFTPNVISVSAGKKVAVTLTNNGAISHSFVITALQVDSGLVAPGETKTVTFTAPSAAGSYEYFCNVTGHKDLGMTGTLNVT